VVTINRRLRNAPIVASALDEKDRARASKLLDDEK
jgi:hypothetical protein